MVLKNLITKKVENIDLCQLISNGSMDKNSRVIKLRDGRYSETETEQIDVSELEAKIQNQAKQIKSLQTQLNNLKTPPKK